MARNYKLQWLASSRRWRKQYQGKQYYFPLNDGETKASSYQRCLREWEAKKVEIDRAEKTATEPWLVELLEKLQQTYRNGQDAARFTRASETLRLVRIADSQSIELPVDEGGSVVAVQTVPPSIRAVRSDLDKYQDDLLLALQSKLDNPTPEHRPWENHEDTPIERTIGALLDRFQKSNRKVDRNRLKTFRKWCDEYQDAGEINGSYCREYYRYIMGRVQAGVWSPCYGKTLFGTFTHFVRWLFGEVEILDHMPRNLKKLRIETPPKQVEVFSVEDVKRYLNAADERLELSLLLMLNCGMTQIDIADLHPSEVDWQAGRIIRKRSKTKQQESVPVCNYRLWPRTFELLQRLRSEDSEGVLLTARGTPLVTRMNGKSRNDSVRLAFRRLMSKLGEKGKKLITFKKTSASLLNSKFGHDVSQLFLGHAPSTVAQKNYIAEERGRLDDPLKWLGQRYSLEDKSG